MSTRSNGTAKSVRYCIYGHKDGRLEIRVADPRLRAALKRNQDQGSDAPFRRTLPKSLKSRPLGPTEFVNPEDLAGVISDMEKMAFQIDKVEQQQLSSTFQILPGLELDM